MPLLFLLLAGCTSRYLSNPFASTIQPSSADAGVLEVYVVDAPYAGLARLYLAIGEVEILQEGSWKMVSRNRKELDLVALANQTELLFSARLDPGEYPKLRFKLKSAKAVFSVVPTDCLRLPFQDQGRACESKLQEQKVSTPTKKVEVAYSFKVLPGETTQVVVDIDLASLQYVKGSYSFSPLVKALSFPQYQLRFFNKHCGDGYCQEVSCAGADCPPVENAENCPQDCTS